jgi:antibiotic biosynthesis monooxygenase (ABM) superfamily enzyme
MVDHAREEGFIYAEHRSLFMQKEQPEALLEALESFQTPSGLERWLSRND